MPAYGNMKELREELREVIEKIREHYDKIGEMDWVPPLEMEVMMAYVHKLLEKAIILKHALEEKEKETTCDTAAMLKQEIKERRKSSFSSLSEETSKQQPQEKGTEKTIVGSSAKKGELTKKEIKVKSGGQSLADKLEKDASFRLFPTFSIAEQYYYSGELFRKNMALFRKVIEEIETLDSYDAAVNHLHHYIPETSTMTMEKKECYEALLKKIRKKFM